jgi:CheY-like chemotaxis protein
MGDLFDARPVEILLVEDSPGDVRLTQEALKESKLLNNLHVARDGVEAMEFLKRKGKYESAVRPDVILLDLNMPRMDGRQVLAEVKKDDELKRIPIVILTISKADEDIVRTYELGANCYITKPVDLEQFNKVVKAIDNFWFEVVTLPPKN